MKSIMMHISFYKHYRENTLQTGSFQENSKFTSKNHNVNLMLTIYAGLKLYDLGYNVGACGFNVLVVSICLF